MFFVGIIASFTSYSGAVLTMYVTTRIFQKWLPTTGGYPPSINLFRVDNAYLTAHVTKRLDHSSSENYFMPIKKDAKPAI